MDGTNTIFSCDRNKAAQLLAGIQTNTPVVAPTYSATISLDPSQALFQQITTTSAIGNATINASDAGKFGQLLVMEIANDSGGARTITFGTNFRSTGTLVGTASKSYVLIFFSNGTSWLEASRSVGALT